MITDDASPLQEIERRVQLRAKEVSLDMAGEGGKAKLRALIADEVAAWTDGYKRGLRAFDLADPDVVAERAYRNLAGYGPLEPLLADDDVWEMMIAGFSHLHISQKCRSEHISSCLGVRPIAPFCAPLVVQMWCRSPTNARFRAMGATASASASSGGPRPARVVSPCAAPAPGFDRS